MMHSFMNRAMVIGWVVDSSPCHLILNILEFVCFLSYAFVVAYVVWHVKSSPFFEVALSVRVCGRPVE